MYPALASRSTRNSRRPLPARSHGLDTVCRALAEAGLEYVAAYDAGTRGAGAGGQRAIYVVAGSAGKQYRKRRQIQKRTGELVRIWRIM